MEKNLGSIDKTLRVSIAVIVTILYFVNLISGTAAIVVLILAAIFLISGLVGFCPLYWVFGISSRKDKKTVI